MSITIAEPLFQTEPIEEDFSGKTVSYSQYKIWLTCPLQWKLIYVDGHRDDSSSIEAVFGTSIHETIQEWLPSLFANEKRSKSVDLNPVFKTKLIDNFKKESKDTPEGKKEYVCDAATLQSYYEEGCLILDHVQKYAQEFFPTKHHKLLECELKLMVPLTKNLKFKAYLDIVVHDEKLDLYHIIDLKTSRRGWSDYQKKDKSKINQILLYKHFYSKMFNVSEDKIIPRFIILKRQIFESSDFVIKRLSKFEPAHGKISIKKATDSFQTFVSECFTEGGTYRSDAIKATPSESNCKFCPFANRPDICSVSYNERTKKAQAQNRAMLV